MSEKRAIEAVLDVARWAPSGDNTQPWRFSIVDDGHAVVHGSDTRDHCVYDLDGRPSQMSVGALIETAAIAASAHGLAMRATRRPDTAETSPAFDLHFVEDAAVARDPLVEAIAHRSVQRRPYARTPLTAQEKTLLEGSVGAQHSVRWIEGRAGRHAMARMLFRSARLRLVTPEAYRVHHAVIEWNRRYSTDRVPDQALGVGRPMLAMMRFAMQNWGRVSFFNRYLAGTWMPRIQMDFVPALACAAHFLLIARQPPIGIDANIAAGRAVQRFWLTAAHLGLMLQPELTPLIFARFAHEGRNFSTLPDALGAAGRVSEDLTEVMGGNAVTHGVFIGRIGHAPRPSARSTRAELAALMHDRPDRA